MLFLHCRANIYSSNGTGDEQIDSIGGMKMRKLALFLAITSLIAMLIESARSAEMPAPFRPVIDMYRTAIAEHWEKDWDKLEANGIPVEFGYGGETPRIVASLVDVDSSQLLVIYDEGWRESLFAAYAIKDCEAVRLFTGAARNRWNLVHDDDGRILFENEGSSSAFDGFNFYYTLKDGNLSFVRGIFYDDRATDRDKKRGPWFETTTEPDFSRAEYWRVGREITEAEAVAVTSKFEGSRHFPKGEPVR